MLRLLPLPSVMLTSLRGHVAGAVARDSSRRLETRRRDPPIVSALARSLFSNISPMNQSVLFSLACQEFMRKRLIRYPVKFWSFAHGLCLLDWRARILPVAGRPVGSVPMGQNA